MKTARPRKRAAARLNPPATVPKSAETLLATAGRVDRLISSQQDRGWRMAGNIRPDVDRLLNRIEPLIHKRPALQDDWDALRASVRGGTSPDRWAHQLRALADRLTAPPDKPESPSTAQGATTSIGDLLATDFNESIRLDSEALAVVKSRLDGTYAGLQVEVASVGAQVNRLDIVARIRDASGRSVGTVKREFHRDGDGTMWAYHALLQIDSAYQGQGFAQAWNDHLIEWYRESGMSHVAVTANIDVGGYTWARQGFDFADSYAAGRIRDRLRGWLDSNRGMLQAEQVLTAEAMLKRLDGTFGSPGYPTAYEVSQTGRLPGQDKRDDVWPGRAAMLGSYWSGIKWL